MALDKIDLRNNSPALLEQFFAARGFNRVKVNNFKRALRCQTFAKIDRLKGVRQLKDLAPELPYSPLKLIESLADERGTEKFVFETADGYRIEAVLMPDKENISICLSSQAGCRLKCAFCQTGKMGLKRNLLPHEIIDQAQQIYRLRIHPSRLACLSFMGMGEPFDNLAPVMQAIEWLNSEWGFQIGLQKMTISTSGCLPFTPFYSYPALPNLALSLHSANPAKRRTIMPAARISLDELKSEMITYTERTGKQISIEYCLFKGFNESAADAEELIAYVKDIPCKINLLNYNYSQGSSFQPVSDKELMEFKERLKAAGIPVIYRRSLGTKVGAGCGQLGERV